jgi:hypothetical protein
LSNDARNYLNATIKEEELDVYNRHILDRKGAYPIMIFARLVERACKRLNIPYSTGNVISRQHKMGNGLHVSIADIVQFYRVKFPLDGSPAPSTFNNHRSIYLRAKRCISKLENGELSQENQSYFRMIKALVHTPLPEVMNVQAGCYASLNTFKTEIETLEKAYNKKPKEMEN